MLAKSSALALLLPLLPLSQSRNILHVVYDDFRTDLPIYGVDFIHAPAFTALAARGVVFDRAYCQIAVCSPSRNSFMSGRMPVHTSTWNFFNHIREARCPVTLGEYLEGPVRATWTVGNPEQSGGAGGCCTMCSGDPLCAGWSYVNKTCTSFSQGALAKPCPRMPVDPDSGQPFSCMRGAQGAFPTITTLPQTFRGAGYLTLGVGKLFHDGGTHPFNNATDFAHPPGPGTPPYADPLSWSASPLQYPQGCVWGGVKQGSYYNVTCAALGLPTFGNAYGANAYQLNSAYLTPAVDGCDCSRKDTACIPLSQAGEAHLRAQGCTMDVGADGLGAVPPLEDVPVQLDARTKIAAAAAHSRATGEPFFLEIGFKKPHLTWQVPRDYLELYYPRDSFTPSMPAATVLDASVPPLAWTPFFTNRPDTPLSENATLELRRYYYAAISWADFHLGQVLAELDAQNLTADTAVLVHGDHGWHLGGARTAAAPRVFAPPAAYSLAARLRPLTHPTHLHPLFRVQHVGEAYAMGGRYARSLCAQRALAARRAWAPRRRPRGACGCDAHAARSCGRAPPVKRLFPPRGRQPPPAAP